MLEKMLRILIIEQDELFRLGLRVRLEQEAVFETVTEAEDIQAALRLLQSQAFDVVLFDIDRTEIAGIQLCQQIKQQYNLPILVLASRSLSTLITQLITAGVQGFCLKNVPSQVLVLAIRSITAGASWWDRSATSEIRSVFEHSSQSLSTKYLNNPLTQREQEIFALIAAGKTNQEIANSLYIAPSTVRVHIHAVFQKLNVHDRTQALVIALQNNFIASDLLPPQ